MRLLELAQTSERVVDLSARRAKVAVMAAFLRALGPDEIGLGVAYLSGGIRQARTGIGPALVRQSMITVAATAPTLTLQDIDDALESIANIGGAGAQTLRAQRLKALMARATPPEQSYLARLLLGELRQGALEGLMIEAVAEAASLPSADLRRAAMVAGGIASVARTALVHGAAGLLRHAITIFSPLAPMLAQPADDIEDALHRVPAAALEWKFDGARVQVHKDGDEVRVFSRTGNDVTAVAPEVVREVRRAHARTLILDGEVIALMANGAPYPFQQTMSRFGRERDADTMRAEIPLSAFFFDCMRRDGDDLVALPAAARYETLAAAVPPESRAPRLVTNDIAAAQAFYDDAIARGHEGVMVKDLTGTYDPGARSASWLKVKRTHTLDLVVLAAEWGHGRRHGKLSNLHLGALDPDSGEFVMLGKTFKGMTDAMLAWQTVELLRRAVTHDEWTVRVRPELVVEVTFNDLQASSRYPAGLALRFARVKGYRSDKTALDADTMVTVRAIYAGQRR